jgi:hypothetical protein
MVYRPREGGQSMGPPWTSQWPAAGAWPSGRSGAWQLAVEAQEARGRRGDPSGGLTSGRGAARQASSGGEQSSAVALGVRGVQGEEVKRGEQG